MRNESVLSSSNVLPPLPLPPASRVISAIINVGQDAAGHPWPLDILGYDGEAHKVFLSPGEMVWYESAR